MTTLLETLVTALRLNSLQYQKNRENSCIPQYQDKYTRLMNETRHFATTSILFNFHAETLTISPIVPKTINDSHTVAQSARKKSQRTIISLPCQYSARRRRTTALHLLEYKHVTPWTYRTKG